MGEGEKLPLYLQLPPIAHSTAPNHGETVLHKILSQVPRRLGTTAPSLLEKDA